MPMTCQRLLMSSGESFSSVNHRRRRAWNLEGFVEAPVFGFVGVVLIGQLPGRIRTLMLGLRTAACYIAPEPPANINANEDPML